MNEEVQLSPTALNQYIKCGLAFKVQYILKATPPEPATPQMQKGSRIHEAIAAGYDLDDPDEQGMVERARAYLLACSGDPIMETKHGDRFNPGRMAGEFYGHPAVAVFDVHWLEPSMAIDWKTGAFNTRYTNSQEVQAYILAELYSQKYGQPLEQMSFVFLPDGTTYEARCIGVPKVRKRIATMIEKAVRGIEGGEFEKKSTPLCRHCVWRTYCWPTFRAQDASDLRPFTRKAYRESTNRNLTDFRG